MLAPGDFLTVPVPEGPNQGSDRSTLQTDRRPTSGPPRPEPPDDRPQTFLEALRRMLASIHS